MKCKLLLVFVSAEMHALCVFLVLVSVSSQSAVRKEHPWMKLVDPGPWHRLPPAPFAHSRHRPVTFNPFLEDNEDESKDEEVLNEDSFWFRKRWFFTGLYLDSSSLD